MRRTAAVASALALPATLCLTLLAGCGSTMTELAVRFAHAPNSTDPDPAQVAAVRLACPGSGHVVLERASTSTLPSIKAVPVRYDTTGASDAEVADVEACLHRQPGVASVSPQGGDDA